MIRLRWTPDGMMDVRTGAISPFETRELPPGFGRGICVMRDYEAYDCPITGKMIEGRHAHEENLKQHGVRVIEKGEKEEAIRNRRDRDKQTEAAITETIVNTANSMGLTD